MGKKSELRTTAMKVADEVAKRMELMQRERMREKKAEDALCMKVGRASLKMIRKLGVKGEPEKLAAEAIMSKYGEAANGGEK